MNLCNKILAVFLLCITIKESTSKCKQMLHKLAGTQQHYVLCSNNFAVPVNLCMNCLSAYNEMLEAYTNLTENCFNEFFENDRLNVVETTQNLMLSLWKKAYCEDCYTNMTSSNFQKLNADLTSCFLEVKDDTSKCSLCLDQYLALNKFYNELYRIHNEQVCYDLQDVMNRTRAYWSKQLKCCHREFRMEFFLTISIGVGLLPILFYMGSFILTKRRERNHAMLNITEDIENDRLIDTVLIAPQMQNRVEERSRNGTLKDKIVLESDEDTDSDNESISKMQK